MGLAQVTTTNVTSNVASVSLTGIDDDSNYIVFGNNIFFDSNDDMRIRFTVSGSADTSSNYDYAYKSIQAGTSFANNNTTNSSNIDFNQGTGTSASNPINFKMHLYNFNNSSEFSFFNMSNAHRNTSQGRHAMFTGGGVLTEAQTTDGVHFYLNSGNNFANGRFTLYKVT
tara:strand:- start:1892 stop:2401 length:510 start_codon:yes stop_codon:yes gene_type:complete